MRARVARFYGWSHSEIKSMSFSIFFEYYQCIEKLEAHEMNNEIRIEVFPQLKKGPREKFSNDIRSLAYDGFESSAQPKSNKEIALDLARKLSSGR
jgi:hypothetical protein